MIRTETIADLKANMMKTGAPSHGFVPTMGALHNGHMALVKRAVSESSLVTVSIFVNPTQFNDKNDLEKYPRTLENDLKMLSRVLRPNDIVFIPPVSEIYPRPDTRVFDFGTIATVMEGLHRPGHFNGVAQVVSRLFDIVEPDIAYFGQKDFQQLAIIKELVRQSGSRIKIVGCPIVREADGLAMSSRNTLLEPTHRKASSIIYQSLIAAAEQIQVKGIEKSAAIFRDAVESVQGFSLQYFEVVDDSQLIPVRQMSDICTKKQYYICVAIFAGKIRLIDNMPISLE
jgi:pantoate--beta-alanine ligase